MYYILSAGVPHCFNKKKSVPIDTYFWAKVNVYNISKNFKAWNEEDLRMSFLSGGNASALVPNNGSENALQMTQDSQSGQGFEEGH